MRMVRPIPKLLCGHKSEVCWACPELALKSVGSHLHCARCDTAKHTPLCVRLFHHDDEFCFGFTFASNLMLYSALSFSFLMLFTTLESIARSVEFRANAQRTRDIFV